MGTLRPLSCRSPRRRPRPPIPTPQDAHAPQSSASCTIEGKDDKGGFEISAGLAFEPEAANRLQFEPRYDAYRSSHTVQHDLVAKVRLGF